MSGSFWRPEPRRAGGRLVGADHDGDRTALVEIEPRQDPPVITLAKMCRKRELSLRVASAAPASPESRARAALAALAWCHPESSSGRALLVDAGSEVCLAVDVLDGRTAGARLGKEVDAVLADSLARWSPGRLYLSGAGARSDALPDQWSRRARIETRVVNPFRNIRVSDDAGDWRVLRDAAPRYFLALGVALLQAGLGKPRIRACDPIINTHGELHLR